MSFQEPRSFVEEDDDMDVDPMPTRNVTLPKLAKGFNQLHRCFEINTAKTNQVLDKVTALEKDINFIKRLPRRVIWWLILTAVSAWIGLFVQNIYLHNQTTQQVQQAAQTVATAKAHP